LLPAYRGLNSLYWALYEGQRTVGGTIHRMAAVIDGGGILRQLPLSLSAMATPDTIYPRIAALAAMALRQAITDILASGTVHGRPQTGVGSYRSHPSKEYDRLVPDWSLPAHELVRRCGVFAGWTNIPASRR